MKKTTIYFSFATFIDDCWTSNRWKLWKFYSMNLTQFRKDYPNECISASNCLIAMKPGQTPETFFRLLFFSWCNFYSHNTAQTTFFPFRQWNKRRRNNRFSTFPDTIAWIYFDCVNCKHKQKRSKLFNGLKICFVRMSDLMVDLMVDRNRSFGKNHKRFQVAIFRIRIHCEVTELADV